MSNPTGARIVGHAGGRAREGARRRAASLVEEDPAMSSDAHPPLLAFGLADADPAIRRGLTPHVARHADDAATRPPLLAFGLADGVPSLRAPGLEAAAARDVTA
jgi:hypothetical protein